MKENTSFSLQYLPLRVSLKALKDAELPSYLGSTLRGVIGKALYETDKAAYDFLYENGKKSEGMQDSVKPYVIIPPERHGERMMVRQGEELQFEFLLLGSGVTAVRSFVKAMEHIDGYGIGAQRAPFCLSGIMNSREHRAAWWNGIYYEEGVRNMALPYYELEHVTGAAIRLCTPLRIRRGGQLLTSITFLTLMRNIFRRLTAIAERYGGWVDSQETGKLLELAERVLQTREAVWLEQMERYSNRRQAKMDFSGLLGELDFEGDLSPFAPWLRAAEILHIGRNTTFGMGQIEVYFR